MKASLFVLLLAVGSASAQNEIIIDNPQAEFTGSWTPGNSSKDRYGADYRAAGCVAGEATATAIYHPDIVIAGKYDVEVSYPKGGNRSTKALWTVTSADGTTTATVNQQQKGGEWVRIASGVKFNVGKSGFIQLANNTGEDQETPAGRPVVLADAVRLVRSVSSAVASNNSSSDVSSGSKKLVRTSTTRADQNWVHSLKASADGDGSVTISPDQAGYAANDLVELTAHPKHGLVFAGWVGDITSLDNPLKVRMTNNISVTAEFLPAATGVIMEVSDAVFEGQWTTNQQAWSGARSVQYQFSPTHTGATAAATYQPKLAKAGLYDIYIWYMNGQNRATNAQWEISCKTGKFTVPMNQRDSGRDWVLLSSGKEFDAGAQGYVRLSNNADPIPGVVVADAVAFVYAGPTDPVR